ncbi:MAG: hypothetical protein ACI845_000770 [Gammaproteobacteria bacterium]|jgi:hypothetical protein
MTQLSSYPASTLRNQTASQFKAALIIITMFLGACSTTMQMLVPSDIRVGTDVIAATERSLWSGFMADETFTLGEYKVINVDRDWDSSESDTISINKLDLKLGSTEGGYDYQFKTPNGQMKGICASGTSEESLGMSGFKVEEKEFNLSCTCRDGRTEVAKVTVQAKNLNNYIGTLTTQGKSYKVVSLEEVEGYLSSGASGYRVDGNQPVGAVEVLKPGRIWLGRYLKQAEKSALACTFVGLMLYMPPQ